MNESGRGSGQTNQRMVCPMLTRTGCRAWRLGQAPSGWASSSGSQRNRPSASAGSRRHRPGRDAVGELQQQVAAVQAIKRLQSSLQEELPGLVGAVGGAVDAEQLGRHVGAEAEGAVLGAAVALVEAGVFFHVPEAEVAEAHGEVREQGARHVDGALRREHAEVGLEKPALVAGRQHVGEGVIRRGDFRAEAEDDAGDHAIPQK